MTKKDLISLKDRTPEERKEIAKKGGIKSGESKREKKLLSETIAEVIAEMSGVTCEEGETLKDVIKGVLKQKSPASVSLIKVMLEATEGAKLKVESESKIIYMDKDDSDL